jgi:hypothetical protein
MKVFKWWWGWNTEKIENWLEEMEAKGLRLSDVSWGGTIFRFEEVAPRKVSYCIDYQPKLEKDYINLIQEDNWELIPMGAGWHICRQEYESECPDLYTDYDSLIDRNKKLLAIIVAIGVPAFTVWPTLIKNQNYFPSALLAVVCLFYIFSIVNLLNSNRLLNEKKRINDK